jgi:DNA repair exonuclease SbcCD ATPase subunit
LSYGDYVTTLEIPALSQCLITGEVMDDEDKEIYDAAPLGRKKRSNGAGKTTVVSILQWILFGRTSHTPNPGDGVMNWFTGKDCWGRIEFKNGDSITRTRATGGHNELIYVKDGDENRLTADTLSTTKNQQAAFARAFNLDWEIFCGSTFFSQYGLPWMDMADQTRKKALERLLHVDRFDYYSKVAKVKCERLDTLIEKCNAKKAALEREIARLESEIGRIQEAAANFGNLRQKRYQQTLDVAMEELRKRDAIKIPDIEKLKAKWDVVKQVEQRIAEKCAEVNSHRDKANDLNNQISEHDSNAAAAEKRIKLWQEKDGKICTSCEQAVPHEHVGSRVEPLQKRMDQEKQATQTLRDKQTEIRTRQKELQAVVAKMEQLLQDKKPAMTIRDAQTIQAQWDQHDREAKRLTKQADNILKEENPHEGSITASQQRIEEAQKEIAAITKETERNDYLNRHYHYVYRAYSDRSKVKSLVFRDHIPFINNRLRHYLDVFGLDIHIELTDSLSISSNLWGYKFESGGEKMRTNVAFMLAAFDFHEHMYGRQCNVLVLDEVDGRLDDDGIDSLINVIKNDLAGRVETILIISHREHMQDTFAKEIKVRRRNRFSTLEVVG